MNQDFLDTMARSSRARVREARAERSEEELRAQIARVPAAPPLALSPKRFDLIAEVKLRSPAHGQLRGADDNVVERVAKYAAAGAAAISVLTEPSRFDGSLQHLETAVRSLAGRAPAMRKDFVVSPYQLLEARAAGAGGALVILRMLPRPDTEALLETARELGLFLLLEAFDERDLELAGELVSRRRADDQWLVGLNCRDLVSLQVVPGRLEKLAYLLPHGLPRVAESGVATPDDAARVAAAGYDMALVGSALMQHLEPLTLVRAMLAAGRAAR
ncbi:MAG TPA: hypothetical protein VMI92_06380 [Steroidobacteraceae bacterium]|nr:hypothetical protein [Steroidobacteraceae bacterium]